ncbi:MAG: hypothetical protein JWO00_339 [Candidatus Parcubacteria bacterium]|nr:hypothetical protein [Candidatus Parcubacteria bacterium]
MLHQATRKNRSLSRTEEILRNLYNKSRDEYYEYFSQLPKVAGSEQVIGIFDSDIGINAYGEFLKLKRAHDSLLGSSAKGKTDISFLPGLAVPMEMVHCLECMAVHIIKDTYPETRSLEWEKEMGLRTGLQVVTIRK